MKLHGFAVAEGQHQSGAGAELRAHGTEEIGRLRTLIVGSLRPRSLSGPTIGELVLLPHPHLILEPQLSRRVRRKAAADFLTHRVEVFLNASIASPSCLYALGRALTCEKPRSLRARYTVSSATEVHNPPC